MGSNHDLGLLTALWPHPEQHGPIPPLPAPACRRHLPAPPPMYLGQLLGVGEVVHGDGQEDIQQGVWWLQVRKGTPSHTSHHGPHGHKALPILTPQPSFLGSRLPLRARALQPGVLTVPGAAAGLWLSAPCTAPCAHPHPSSSGLICGQKLRLWG